MSKSSKEQLVVELGIRTKLIPNVSIYGFVSVMLGIWIAGNVLASIEKLEHAKRTERKA